MNYNNQSKTILKNYNYTDIKKLIKMTKKFQKVSKHLKCKYIKVFKYII